MRWPSGCLPRATLEDAPGASGRRGRGGSDATAAGQSSRRSGARMSPACAPLALHQPGHLGRVLASACGRSTVAWAGRGNRADHALARADNAHVNVPTPATSGAPPWGDGTTARPGSAAPRTAAHLRHDRPGAALASTNLAFSDDDHCRRRPGPDVTATVVTGVRVSHANLSRQAACIGHVPCSHEGDMFTSSNARGVARTSGLRLLPQADRRRTGQQPPNGHSIAFDVVPVQGNGGLLSVR